MAGRTGSVMAATGRRIPRERRGEVQRRKRMTELQIKAIMEALGKAGFHLTNKEAVMIERGLSEGRTINTHLAKRMERDVKEIWDNISKFQSGQSKKSRAS